MFLGPLFAAGALALFLGQAVPASATTLDFSAFGFNEDLGLEAILPEATITAGAGTIRRLFSLNGYCVIVGAGCEGTSAIAFVSPVENLTFTIFGTSPGESTDVRAFDASGLLTSFNVAADGSVDLSSFAGITALELTSNVSGAAGGTAFRDFFFDFSAVPEPTSLALLAGALAFGAARRRSRVRVVGSGMMRRVSAAVALVLAMSAGPALALPTYSNLYFLGGSGIDTGNWIADTTLPSYSGYTAFAPLASDGYWQGRWQSGPAYSDYLAEALGHPDDVQPSLLGGNNYAYGVGWMGPLAGETPAAPGSLDGLSQLWFPTQVQNVLGDNPGGFAADALFVIQVGGNDASALFNRGHQGTERGELLVAQIELLRAVGANNFLISTQAGAGAYATDFNAAMQSGLAPLSAAGVGISYVDSSAFNASIFTPPFAALAALGFLDHGSEACIANVGVTFSQECTDAAIAQTIQGNAYLGSTHVSFDGGHLDTKILELQAEFALAALPVPEPGTLALFLPGLIGLGVLRRRAGSREARRIEAR